MAGLDPQAVARALGGEAKGDQVKAPGPGHSAKDRSLSVLLDPNAPDGFVTHSHSGDDWRDDRDYVRERLDLPAFKPNGGGRSTTLRSAKPTVPKGTVAPRTIAKIVATYDYRDADGKVLRQVLKFEPKGFSQRRLLDGPPVIYRWPEILKYPDATVFVCEGEKDADRVATLNLCATTVASGNWADECVKALAGRDVIILEDNDDTGRKKALAAAQALHGTTASIRVVALPGLPDKGDVSDWLDEDPQRDAEKLADVCFEVPLWKPTPPLQWLDMTGWDNEPVPERKWAIRDRVPLNQVGLFSGEGGVGKSIIELMKDVAHVAAKDWLGSMPEPGPAFYLGAEDDTDELHIRLAVIAKHYGVTFEALIRDGLHILPLLGKDSMLCVPNRGGQIETTNLYKLIYEAAGDLKPKNISVDTLSRAFGGNEIDRVQVYGFAMHMQALAKVASGSVTVLSHPSLAGMASGSGISGSTAWHGAFRFRQYLKGVKDEEGEQPENDLRELEFKKNQYGPLGESIALRYTNGLFLPLAGVSDLERRAREAKADMTFTILLKRFAGQGRNVSHKKPAKNYAPKQFADEQEAKTHKLRKSELEAAMQRLFLAREIHVATYGRPSQPTQRLAVGTQPEPNVDY